MDLEQTLKDVFDRTQIVRRPVTGVVSGYHELPYRLVGPLPEGSVLISGTIRVSPRLVLTLRQFVESYGAVFEGDEGFMDAEIVQRRFQFAVARDTSKSIRNEHLHIEPRHDSLEELLEKVEDELARAEDTRIALISCPSPRFYPISIDKFLREILPREMRE
jgi:hypothetical protein